SVEVPYTLHLSLSIGSSVTIRGKPAVSFSKDPQMQVDFHTGTSEKSDIAFHFRVYFGHRVVMNSLQAGGWKREVAVSHMLFSDGQHFDLRFLVLQNEYQGLCSFAVKQYVAMEIKYSTSLAILGFHAFPPPPKLTQKKNQGLPRYVAVKL
uniref:Galectin n=1 Tax=Loxodonta africana TaxID=9785 RepID=G3UB87_LOXAF